MLEQLPHFEFLSLRAQYEETFKHHSTLVRCHMGKHLAQGTYSGLMTQDACKSLGGSFQAFAAGHGTIERIDGAVTSAFHSEPCIDHMIGTRPGAYIVRPDQFEAMDAFARFLSTLGVVRSVWLREHFHHANGWCEAVNG